MKKSKSIKQFEGDYYSKSEEKSTKCHCGTILNFFLDQYYYCFSFFY